MSGAPAWLKVTIGGLSRIAPGPVARLANAVYRRPAIARRFDTGQRDLLTIAAGILDDGDALDIEVAGGSLRFYRFRPEAPIGSVLLLHGWTADSRAMAAFVEPLLKAEYEAVLIDLPGHGDSFGDGTDVGIAASAVLEGMAQLDLAPDAVIGHSYGGGVACMLAHLGFAPKRFACIASPCAIRSITDDFCAAFNLSPATKEWFEQIVADDLGMPLADLDAVKIWPERDTKILILHAPDDAEVDFWNAERIATLPDASLQAMPGLGHREIVYRPASVQAAVAFVTGRIVDVEDVAATSAR